MLALAGEDTPRTLVAPAVPQHKVVSDAGVIGALLIMLCRLQLW